jgi:transcriptional regulator with XRE-family HTH domain
MTELREKHRLAQVELAEKTGLPQAQIGRIERGAVRPTSATRAKIAEALGLTFVSSSGLSAVFGGALPAEGRGASRLASDPLISRLSRGRRRAHSFVAVWITG